jgi:hypothetical protein
VKRAEPVAKPAAPATPPVVTRTKQAPAAPKAPARVETQVRRPKAPVVPKPAAQPVEAVKVRTPT